MFGLAHYNLLILPFWQAPSCDDGKGDVIETEDADVLKSDIDLNQKVASVICPAPAPSSSPSECSSVDDYDLHCDGFFTYGDFYDSDRRIAAISADVPIDVDDLSTSSSDSSASGPLGLFSTIILINHCVYNHQSLFTMMG